MAMDANEIARLIREGIPGATVTIRDLAGDGDHYAAEVVPRLLGEGAYFAPELGNVWIRYGGLDDPKSAREGLYAWLHSQPSGVEGRRQMPDFHLTDQETNDLIDFLEFTSRVKTQGWPPKASG